MNFRQIFYESKSLVIASGDILRAFKGHLKHLEVLLRLIVYYSFPLLKLASDRPPPLRPPPPPPLTTHIPCGTYVLRVRGEVVHTVS